ncbi:MAG: hypothetical protein ACRDNS_33555 [Trebonia sp.]
MAGTGRPAPYPIPWPGHAVVVIPAADFAEQADWLARLCEMLEGRERPGCVKQLRMTERMKDYREFWDRAARAVAITGS